MKPNPNRNAKESWRTLFNAAFYLVVGFILTTSIVSDGRNRHGFHLLGYSSFTVLSDSMQPEIPRGALIITREKDPELIIVGEDITFMRMDNAAVTHRVTEIYDDYLGSGTRAFQTQGLANPDPDVDPVYARNIIGTVVLIVPELGYGLTYLLNNIGSFFLLCTGLVLSETTLRLFLMERKHKQTLETTGN